LENLINFFIFIDSFEYLDQRLTHLKSLCFSELRGQGFLPEQISVEYFLHMRYDGTDCALMCTGGNPGSGTASHGDFLATFIERYVFL